MFNLEPNLVRKNKSYVDGKTFKDVVDLLLKTTTEHLIGLIQHEETDVVDLWGKNIINLTCGGKKIFKLPCFKKILSIYVPNKNHFLGTFRVGPHRWVT